MMIETYLGIGAENAKTRWQLMQDTGMCDRAVRHNISNARKRGVPIVSSSRCAGYFIAATDAEKQIAVVEYSSRARQCFRTASKLSQHTIGQQTLEV